MTTSTIPSQITFYVGFSNINYFAVWLRLSALIRITPLKLRQPRAAGQIAGSLNLRFWGWVYVFMNQWHVLSYFFRRSKSWRNFFLTKSFVLFLCSSWKKFHWESISHWLDVDEFFMQILMVHEGENEMLVDISDVSGSPRVNFNIVINEMEATLISNLF